jgi:hypothetical protein
LEFLLLVAFCDMRLLSQANSSGLSVPGLGPDPGGAAAGGGAGGGGPPPAEAWVWAARQLRLSAGQVRAPGHAACALPTDGKHRGRL